MEVIQFYPVPGHCIACTMADLCFLVQQLDASLANCSRVI